MRIRKQKGLSLVEVMIAITLGSVLTLGIVQLFVANSETHRLMMGQSRMQESARFAFDFIGRSLQRAGYRGCFSSQDQLHDTFANPNLIPYEFNLNLSVQGFDGQGSNIWIPALDVLPQTDASNNDTNIYYMLLVNAAQDDLNAAGMGQNTGVRVDQIIDNTDVLTTRNMEQHDVESRLDQRLIGDAAIVAHLQPGDVSPVEDHHLAVIHDCAQATIFKVTDLLIGGGFVSIFHTALTSTPPTDDTFPIQNRIGTLDTRSIFEEDAAVAAIESHTYYIAPGAGLNAQGRPTLSLWRKSGLLGPVELVEGVEDLQILYGVTTNGDDTPNRYVAADQLQTDLDWRTVRTVRVSIVVNSIDDVGGQSSPTHGCLVQACYDGEPETGIDGLSRRAFTQTFMLRNSS